MIIECSGNILPKLKNGGYGVAKQIDFSVSSVL